MTNDLTPHRSVMDNELYPPRPAQLAECWIREWRRTFGRWPTKGRWPGRAAGFGQGTYCTVLRQMKRAELTATGSNGEAK